MAAQKLDFSIQPLAESLAAPADLKAGSIVSLLNLDLGKTLQVQYKDSPLGQVPTEQQQQLEGSSYICTVRSIRKQDGKITQVMVRAVLSDPVPGVIPNPSTSVGNSDRPEELEGTTQLLQHQLELLVGDESVQTLLKDERLQKQILTVDTADDREKALQQHSLDPNFKAFADKVLDIVVAS